jgi:Raf kinase inhibitor-like YbhB/YbcL family protein
MKKTLMLIISLGILLLAMCASPATEADDAPALTAVPALTETTSEDMELAISLELTSTAFAEGGPIPVRYSCDGKDISPPLVWDDPPEGTQSLALIMDDPDAPVGTWDHWIVFNIPTELRKLPEAVSTGDINATFGKNSWGRNDYGGPCPPSGTHRYFFKLYALDTTLSLDENADKGQVIVAMDGHVLAETELMGTFSR